MKEKIVENGTVYELNEYHQKNEIGKIAKVELSVEYPSETLGILRVKDSTLYDEHDDILLIDYHIIDNQEYYSATELLNSISKHYDISKDLIELV